MRLSSSLTLIFLPAITAYALPSGTSEYLPSSTLQYGDSIDTSNDNLNPFDNDANTFNDADLSNDEYTSDNETAFDIPSPPDSPIEWVPVGGPDLYDPTVLWGVSTNFIRT